MKDIVNCNSTDTKVLTHISLLGGFLTLNVSSGLDNNINATSGNTTSKSEQSYCKSVKYAPRLDVSKLEMN